MAFQTVPLIPFPNFVGSNNNRRFLSTLLDAAGEAVGHVFQAPKTGSIVGLGFRTGTVTTGDDLDIRLETVDLSNGLPSGTLATTNANGTVTVADTDDGVWKEGTFTASHSATAGDWLAAIVEAPTGYSGSLNLNYVDRHSPYSGPAFSAYPVRNTGSWVSAAGDYYVIAVEYSGGVYHLMPNVPGVSSLSSTSFDSSSSPDEVGVRFTLPVPMRSCGCWVQYTTDPNGTFTAKLYDSADTLLASKSFDSDIESTNVGVGHFLWGSSIELDAGATYRLTVVPDGAENVSLGFMDYNANAYLGQANGGINWYATERTDAGSWTDTNTRVYDLGLLLDGLDDGAGGGGTTRPVGLHAIEAGAS